MQDREHDVNGSSEKELVAGEQPQHPSTMHPRNAEQEREPGIEAPEASFGSQELQGEHPEPPQAYCEQESPNQVQSAPEPPAPVLDSRPHMFTERISVQQISFKASETEAVELRGARTLMTAANILGPLSLFFGGVLASSVGLGAAVAAYFKLDKVGKNHPDDPRIWQVLTRQALVSIMITGSTLVLNIIAAILFYPIIFEAVQSGDFSGVFNGFGTTPPTQEAAPANGSSTWG